MKVLAVAGCRDIRKFRVVGHYLTSEAPHLIICGDCPTGVDSFTVDWARKHGIRLLPVAALWHKGGKEEGPIRNRVVAITLADYRASDHECAALAFPVSGYPGTYSCIRALREYGFEPQIVQLDLDGAEVSHG